MNEKGVEIKKALRECGIGSGESEYFAKLLEAMGFEVEDEKRHADFGHLLHDKTAENRGNND